VGVIGSKRIKKKKKRRLLDDVLKKTDTIEKDSTPQ
jgi:hypothetical protein